MAQPAPLRTLCLGLAARSGVGAPPAASAPNGGTTAGAQSLLSSADLASADQPMGGGSTTPVLIGVAIGAVLTIALTASPGMPDDNPY